MPSIKKKQPTLLDVIKSNMAFWPLFMGLILFVGTWVRLETRVEAVEPIKEQVQELEKKVDDVSDQQEDIQEEVEDLKKQNSEDTTRILQAIESIRQMNAPAANR